MGQVVYADALIELESGQSVLDALLDAGHEIPNSCKVGACHSCLMRADEGVIPSDAQAGLKETLKEQGFFLSCRCHPESELKISDANREACREAATIESKSWLSQDILRIRLASNMSYLPGQYITLWNENIGRSYSIASIPSTEKFIELHVKVLPDGMISQWLQHSVSEGSTVEIQGPAGNCFYTSGNVQQPIILAALGTGLAPLYGILREALHQGHSGKIHLFAAASTSSNLYYLDELKTLEEIHPQLTVTFCALENNANLESIVTGDINDIVKAAFPVTAGMRAYLCGSAERVRKLKKLIFLQGANRQDIYADEFV